MSAIETTLDQTEKARLNDLMKVADRAGILRLPAVIEAKIDNLDAALNTKRQADLALTDAKDAHAEAVGYAALIARRDLIVEGNKTWLADPDGTRTHLTADDAKTWVARRVAQDDTVRAAASDLRAAEVAAGQARDNVTVCEARLSGAKYALTASCELARLLTTTFEGHIR